MAKDGTVLRQEVLPVALDAPDSDVADEKGKPLLAAGQWLFRLHAATGVVDCVLDAKRPGAIGRLLDADATRLCLRDGDGDGRFESYFHYAGKVPGLPTVSGKVPKTPHAIAPVAYAAQDVHDAAGLFYVGIDYSGHAPLSGAPRFVLVHGRSGGEHGMLTQGWAKKVLPSEVTINGARLTVLSDSGDAVRVRVEAALPTTEMAMWQYGSFGFY